MVFDDFPISISSLTIMTIIHMSPLSPVTK